MIDLDAMTNTLCVLRRIRTKDVDPLTVMPEEVKALIQMQEELEPLINSLANLNERIAIRLRFIDGRTPKELACATGRNERSVFYYLRDGRRHLQQMFPEQIRQREP